MARLSWREFGNEARLRKTKQLLAKKQLMYVQAVNKIQLGCYQGVCLLFRIILWTIQGRGLGGESQLLLLFV